MIYVLSKVLWFFATPSNALLFLTILGLLLRATRRARLGQRLALTGAAGLLAAGLSPVGSLMLMPLENRFPAYRHDGSPVDGIVVLGGAIETDPTVSRGQLSLNEAGERFVVIGELARLYPQARIVFAGGGSGFNSDVTPEAELVERWTKVLGLPSDRLLYERQSLNTAQNGAMTKAMADPKPGERWLLVTSAWHMPRAMGVFRKAGFDAVPYPVDFRTPAGSYGPDFPAAASEGLRRTDMATKEWVGLLAYWLMGHSDDMYPGPIAPNPA